MSDVMINGRQIERGQVQNHSTECDRGITRYGPVPAFLRRLCDILTASPSELMRRLTEGMDRIFEDTSLSPMTLWSPSIAISEMNGQIKVFAELPGSNKDDVRVNSLKTS